MISQPMAGKTEEEIVSDRNRAIGFLKSQGYEVVNTLFTDKWYSPESMKERGVVNVPLCFVAKSLENMCLCDTVYFVNGWQEARGCQVEHFAARSYGLSVIHEGDIK